MVDPVFKPVQVSVGAAAGVGAAALAHAPAPVTNAGVMYFSLIRMVTLLRWGRLSHSRVALRPAPVVTAGARTCSSPAGVCAYRSAPSESCEALNRGLLTSVLTEMLSAATG